MDRDDMQRLGAVCQSASLVGLWITAYFLIRQADRIEARVKAMEQKPADERDDDV